MFAQLIPFLKALPRRILKWYISMPRYAKTILWLWILFEIFLVTVIALIGPSRVAQFLYDNAEKLAQSQFGWLIIGLLIACISFPPLAGHTTLTGLCGYAWGVPTGFYIAAPASLIGAAFAFTTLRLSFRKRLHNFSKTNEKWQALESVISAKGLSLIILIRMSPFPPWVYSNVLFASIGSVALWQFVVATLFVFPKLFLHVYIGSLLAALSDGEQRKHMDTQLKVLNGVLIGGSIFITIVASWFIYTSIQAHIRSLPGIPPEIDELAAEAIEDSEEAPLLTSV
ncbi:hypothetical protein MIND_00700500 [Mycena indigotica]|uniref:Golgi apparatus membrane protein TVP38 n=1 Tax=Mycena indigotica TaxID=2126181 RepID=A0A8H6W4E2_9AGAR|nr:uncharacterized protein MIND_00700500 [Mycena indigotica]KAF7301353.1 hypothetical protein MIND_00700500 [Mycena indigotica]